MIGRWDRLIEHTARREEDLRGELVGTARRQEELVAELADCDRREASAADRLPLTLHPQFAAYATRLCGERQRIRGDLARGEREQERLRTELIVTHRRLRSLELLRERQVAQDAARHARRAHTDLEELVLRKHLESAGELGA